MIRQLPRGAYTTAGEKGEKGGSHVQLRVLDIRGSSCRPCFIFAEAEYRLMGPPWYFCGEPCLHSRGAPFMQPIAPALRLLVAIACAEEELLIGVNY